MNEVLDEIYRIGIVPVIAIDDEKAAKPLAKALLDGGINCAEVTFRTDKAEDAIRIISREFPEMLVGAGTVLTKEQVDRAVDAGAKFIVSPGLNPEIVKYCISKNVPVTPGTSNPSDVEQAISLGLDVVKFFPAEAAGGLKMIKAMSAPYSNIKFMPTGGININNLNDYLDFKKVIACGGSWMVKPEMIKNGEFDKITQMTKEAVNSMLGFELKHIGINSNDENEADKYADEFSKLLGVTKKIGNSSIFAGNMIEVMKKQYLGKNGHIAIGTTNVDRAVYHLIKQGYEFNYETAGYDEEGRLKVIYLKEEIAGFAVHLVNKN